MYGGMAFEPGAVYGLVIYIYIYIYMDKKDGNRWKLRYRNMVHAKEMYNDTASILKDQMGIHIKNEKLKLDIAQKTEVYKEYQHWALKPVNVACIGQSLGI